MVLGCCECLCIVICVGGYVVSGCLGMDCECLVLVLGVCLVLGWCLWFNGRVWWLVSGDLAGGCLVIDLL